MTELDGRMGEERDSGSVSPSDVLLEAVLNSATDFAIFTLDRERRVTSWNIGACNLLGWQAEEMLGRSADEIFTPEDRAADAPRVEVELALAEGRADDERWHLRKNGTRFWASGLLMALKGRDEGRGFLKILRDRTERKRHEELQERHNLLLAEFQHRVRNSLAVMRSIARRSAETSESVEDYAMHLDGRIAALSRAQAMLTRDPAASVDFEYLVAEELAGIAAEEGRQFDVSGPPVHLYSGAAVALALAMHELTTNALKFGAMAQPTGHLTVAWRGIEREGQRRLLIEWRETGVPMQAGAPQRRGFGTELLESSLRYELKAEVRLDFTPDGLLCVIDLPLTPQIALVSEAAD